MLVVRLVLVTMVLCATFCSCDHRFQATNDFEAETAFYADLDATPPELRRKITHEIGFSHITQNSSSLDGNVDDLNTLGPPVSFLTGRVTPDINVFVFAGQVFDRGSLHQWLVFTVSKEDGRRSWNWIRLSGSLDNQIHRVGSIRNFEDRREVDVWFHRQSKPITIKLDDTGALDLTDNNLVEEWMD